MSSNFSLPTRSRPNSTTNLDTALSSLSLPIRTAPSSEPSSSDSQSDPAQATESQEHTVFRVIHNETIRVWGPQQAIVPEFYTTARLCANFWGHESGIHMVGLAEVADDEPLHPLPPQVDSLRRWWVNIACSSLEKLLNSMPMGYEYISLERCRSVRRPVGEKTMLTVWIDAAAGESILKEKWTEAGNAVCDRINELASEYGIEEDVFVLLDCSEERYRLYPPGYKGTRRPGISWGI